MAQHLSHYTNLGAAINILNPKDECIGFKFTKIKNQNDLQEQRLAENHSKEYANLRTASFCLMKEYFPRYRIYGTKEKKEEGGITTEAGAKQGNGSSKTSDNDFIPAMIYFTFKPDCDSRDLFSNVESKGVRYCKQAEFKKYNNSKKVIPKEDIGFIKSNYWKYEKEYRFILVGKPNQSDEFFELKPINLNSLKRIEIYYFPIEKAKKTSKAGQDAQKQSNAIRKLFLGSGKRKTFFALQLEDKKVDFQVHRSSLCKAVRK